MHNKSLSSTKRIINNACGRCAGGWWVGFGGYHQRTAVNIVVDVFFVSVRHSPKAQQIHRINPNGVAAAIMLGSSPLSHSLVCTIAHHIRHTQRMAMAVDDHHPRYSSPSILCNFNLTFMMVTFLTHTRPARPPVTFAPHGQWPWPSINKCEIV